MYFPFTCLDLFVLSLKRSQCLKKELLRICEDKHFATILILLQKQSQGEKIPLH